MIMPKNLSRLMKSQTSGGRSRHSQLIRTGMLPITSGYRFGSEKRAAGTQCLNLIGCCHAPRWARGIRRAAVFGSIARGDDRPGSDIDILVEFEPGAEGTIYEYVRL